MTLIESEMQIFTKKFGCLKLRRNARYKFFERIPDYKHYGVISSEFGVMHFENFEKKHLFCEKSDNMHLSVLYIIQFMPITELMSSVIIHFKCYRCVFICIKHKCWNIIKVFAN